MVVQNFFKAPVHLCAVTYMTEISSTGVKQQINQTKPYTCEYFSELTELRE